MTTSTDRQTYRDLVAQVALKAKTILPQETNGRIESAVKLVLQGDVEPQEDGTIRVGSSDPTRYYVLIGQACTCTDYLQERAPSGWCKHRISAGILKRVTELLPHEPAQICAPTLPLPEAPASVNVRLMIGGRDCQVTLRDTDETRLLARLETLLARYATEEPASTSGSAPAAAAPVCRFHGPMKASSKAPGSFYCTKRLHDGSYCPERGGAQ